MNAATASWTVDVTKILTRHEVATILADLERKARRSVNTRQNRVVFRLATCCGLRASEIVGLTIGDVRVGVDRPWIRIRKTVGKGGRARRVPLWWDRMTLADLVNWREERQEQGARAGNPFVSTQAAGNVGRPLDRFAVRRRFLAACRCLGAERLADLTVHSGRHSVVGHALAGGRSLAEVRDAAGHASIATTSVYTHVAVADDGQVGDLFNFA